jgi:hypothetical protein
MNDDITQEGCDNRLVDEYAGVANDKWHEPAYERIK